jgi:hypothetical protein
MSLLQLVWFWKKPVNAVVDVRSRGRLSKSGNQILVVLVDEIKTCG